MKKSKFILSAIMSVFIVSLANAKEVKVEATGIGSNYDWAVLNALENAVRQTSEIRITSTQPKTQSVITEKTTITVDDDGNLTSKTTKTTKEDANKTFSSEVKNIEAYYDGKVKSYKVTSMKEEKEKVYVTIDAVVEVADNVEYKSAEIITKPEHTLVVMPFKGLKTYSCGKETIPLNVINNNIINSLNKNILSTKKFSVVNRDDLYAYHSEMELINLGFSKDKAKLGNIATADYMVVGTINEFQSFTNTKTIDLTGESFTRTSAKIVVDYSLVELATMETIFTDASSASYTLEGRLVSCEEVIKNLTDQIGSDITMDTMMTVFPEYKYVVEKVTVVPATNKVVETVTTPTPATTKRVEYVETVTTKANPEKHIETVTVSTEPKQVIRYVPNNEYVEAVTVETEPKQVIRYVPNNEYVEAVTVETEPKQVIRYVPNNEYVETVTIEKEPTQVIRYVPNDHVDHKKVITTTTTETTREVVKLPYDK